jgi:hypothetical protein
VKNSSLAYETTRQPPIFHLGVSALRSRASRASARIEILYLDVPDTLDRDVGGSSTRDPVAGPAVLQLRADVERLVAMC